jgi:hypothetical protein
MCGCNNKGFFNNHIPGRTIKKINNNNVSNDNVSNNNNNPSKKNISIHKINFIKYYFEKNNIDMKHFPDALKLMT